MYELLHEITGLIPCIRISYFDSNRDMICIRVDPFYLRDFINKYRSVEGLDTRTDLGSRIINTFNLPELSADYELEPKLPVEYISMINLMGQEIKAIFTKIKQHHPEFRYTLGTDKYDELSIPYVIINLPGRDSFKRKFYLPQDEEFEIFFSKELSYWQVMAEITCKRII